MKVKNSLFSIARVIGSFIAKVLRGTGAFLKHLILGLCKMGKKLYRISIAHPKISYLLLYFFLIFAFAFIYSKISDEFYHSTIKSESYFTEPLITLKTSLNADITSVLKENNNNSPDKFLDNQSFVKIDQIEVKEIEVSENHLDINLFIPVLSTNGGLRGINTSTIRVFGGNRKCNAYPGKLFKSIQILHDRIPGTLQQIGITVAPPCDVQKKDALIVSEYSEQLFNNLTKSSTGSPTELEGDFARMLYLSATTLTTLGLGDITPITNRARLVVTLECILGIILMGMFLNAIANEKTKGEKTVSTTSKSPKKTQQRKKKVRKK